MIYRYQSGDRTYTIQLEHTGPGPGAETPAYRATIDGQDYDLQVLELKPGQITLLFAGRPVSLYWAADGSHKWVSYEGCAYRLDPPAPRSARRPGEPAADDVLRAPMPAQVRALSVAEGDEVEKGQTLLLLEAMKMEIRLAAPRTGRVARLLVQAGQTVDRDQILLELEAPNPA